MTTKTPIRRDENLLAKAKAVFGDDLVTDAFVCTWFYPEVSPPGEEIVRLAEELHDSPKLDPLGISYHGQHIRLVFCNGRIVDFWNSECAGINNPEKEDVSYEA